MTNEVLESLGVRPVASLAPPDHSIRLEWRFLGRGHYANRLIAVALAGGESSDGESQNLIARQCDWLSRLIFKASGICVLCCLAACVSSSMEECSAELLPRACHRLFANDVRIPVGEPD